MISSSSSCSSYQSREKSLGRKQVTSHTRGGIVVVLHQTFLRLAVLALLSSNGLLAEAGSIKVCAKSADDVTAAIPNANVKCWDDDGFSNDDFMTQGVTGSDGCVTMSYRTKKSSWRCTGWDCGWWSDPDIYCEVSGSCLQPFDTHTKNNHNQNNQAVFTAYVEVNEAFCGDSSFNGCGASFFPDVLTDVADSVSGFKDSCNEHDVCYGNCSVTREDCEEQFKNNMYDECNGQFLCERLADLFYQGVTTVGEGICQDSRDPPVCTQAEYDTCTID